MSTTYSLFLLSFNDCTCTCIYVCMHHSYIYTGIIPPYVHMYLCLDSLEFLQGKTALDLSLTRWLPGFARVPYYERSPCHMYPVHNCHHIKSCHPPDKQYIKTHHNTEFIIYTCSLFFICTKVSRARAALWDVCEYTVYWPVPSSGYLPWKFPSLPCPPLPSLPSPPLPSPPLPSPPLPSPPLPSPETIAGAGVV